MKKNEVATLFIISVLDHSCKLILILLVRLTNGLDYLLNKIGIFIASHCYYFIAKYIITRSSHITVPFL